jgi:O-antigen/teichoic acid export membrane protein
MSVNEPSIKRNYFYRLFYEILTLITPFITTPYVSRVLGADGIGIYSYTSSIMSFFVLFAALGTASYGEREIAQHRIDSKLTSKLFWEIECLSVLTTAVCLLVWVVLIVLDLHYRYYFIALIPVLLATAFDISWFFTGLEQVKYIVLRNSYCKLLGIALLFLLVKNKDDLITYMVINSGITLLGNLSMWVYLPRFLVRIKFSTVNLKRHFQETLIYFIPTIATSIYTVLDKTLIGVITQDVFQNGYYEQAMKVIRMTQTLVFSAINSVLGARISYLFAENRIDEIHNRISQSMNFILFLGFGCTFGIIGIADTFVPVFFGKGYTPVVTLLYCLAPIIIIIGISNCLGSQYFTPSGQRKRSAKVIVLGSVINLVFNLILIPRFLALGAAMASLLAEATITFLYVSMSDDFMTFRLIYKYSWKRVLAGGLMCVLVYNIPIQSFNGVFCIIIKIIVGIVSYCMVLTILKDEMIREGLYILKNKKMNMTKRK